jgi:two-component system sensor histidine kinase YesM
MKNRLLRVFIFHSLPLLISSVLFGGGAVFITTRFITRANEEQALIQLEQLQSYYEVILAEMDSLNLMFSTNAEIITRLLRLLESDRWEWTDSYNSRIIRSLISAPANARPYIDSIYVYLYNDQGKVLSSQGGIMPIASMEDSSWYGSFIRNSTDEFRAEYATITTNGEVNRQKNLLRIFRVIYNTQPAPVGVIVLNLMADRLVNDYPPLFTAEDSVLTISDQKGNLLLSTVSASSPAAYFEGSGFVRFSLISQRFGWKYELLVPRDYLYRLPRTIGILTFLLFVSVCILGLFLTYKTNRKERAFLKTVLDQFEAAGASRIEPIPEEKQGNIFDYLNYHILRTFLEQDYLRMQKEVMEYRALQMQINPHFLYNTLETINWKAISLLGEPNDISRMIYLLSKFLKYSMGISQSPGVPLEEEILHTKDYLELQAFRFAGRFSVDWRIESGLEDFQVPRLILQPILENSFVHGSHGDDQPLNITVDIHREEGERVVFVIEDDGEGMEPQTLARLNEDVPAVPGTPAGSREGSGEKHIGFANIRKRIALFYKEKAALSITSKEKAGTKIRMSVPPVKPKALF